MPFMTPEYDFDGYYEVETTDGTEFIPASLVGVDATLEDLSDYLQGTPYEDQEVVCIANGVCVRLSASGYTDATDWVGFTTMDEARHYVIETYEVDPDTGEDLTDNGESVENPES